MNRVEGSVDLPRDPSAPSVARGWLRDRLRGRVPEVTESDVELVVTELVTNALRHGAGTPALVLEAVDGGLRVTVHDADPRSSRVQVCVQRGEADPSGRGLRIVDTLADAWGVTEDSHGKEVWVVLRYAADESRVLQSSAVL